jgi:hypothetical protein
LLSDQVGCKRKGESYLVYECGGDDWTLSPVFGSPPVAAGVP